MALKIDPAEIKAQVKITKKRPLNFGYALAPKPPDSVFAMHKLQAPKKLLREVKAESGSKKGVCGTVETKGKVMSLTLVGKPVGGVVRSLRGYLSSIGLKMKVVLISEDGELLESEGDETEDEDEDEAAEAGADAAPDPNRQKWLAAEAKLGPLVQKALGSGQGDVSKLRAAWGYAVETAGDGDYAGALKVVARIAPMLQAMAAAPAAPASEDDPGKQILAQSRVLWVQSRKKMLAEMKRLEAEILAQERADEDNEPEDIAEVETKIKVAYDYLKPFDGRLEAALLAAVDAADENERKSRVAACRQVLDGFDTHLGQEFFDVVDTDNGYANVAIASTARKSIAAIRKWLG
jgi:hypothetical protein